MILGKRLRELRKRSNKTLRQVNEETGISYSNLAQIERGEHGCTGNMLSLLAAYYGVSVDYLLCNTDNPTTTIVKVVDADGTITEMQHKLLDATKGMTVKDLEEINNYIEFIKSKKGKK